MSNGCAYSQHRVYPPVHPPNPELALVVFLVVCLAVAWYIARVRFHFTHQQLAEISVYTFLLCAWLVLLWLLSSKQKARLEKEWPKPPLVISPSLSRKNMELAAHQDAIVLGYDVYKRPWFWSDSVRSMQTIVLGMSGRGKTTLLKSIIVQDLYRRVGLPGSRRHIPMIILDGKGDLDFFYSLIPHVHRAGRLHHLRIINPNMPEYSVGYNPFHSHDDDYMPQVNMVFGSFNLHDEFFAKHQLNYLADIVRVLFYTKQKFNFYDVIVMALDERVLKAQADKARLEISKDHSISTQKRLNFEMSVNNLYQSLKDRERVPKIQGLLNECMTFLDDELSIITGPYENLLSLDEVIDEELILFVSLNTNKNTEPVKALGKMLLQNIQLMVGKRYANPNIQQREHLPLFSVVLDEFAPFGYRNFATILNTARGTNTAFLFSMQSLPQLLTVSKGFKEDVSSAPNTTICLRTRDNETAEYFIRASSQQHVQRRSLSIARKGWFQRDRYEETGTGNVTDIKEYRVADEHIKNLPKGQMHVLQSDDTLGTM